MFWNWLVWHLSMDCEPLAVGPTMALVANDRKG
jgi:hypothetical protein